MVRTPIGPGTAATRQGTAEGVRMEGGNWKGMFQAACDGERELVEFHVRTGVDIDYAHPEFESTPLVACILAGQEDMALYLLDQGADPTLFSLFDGMTPIQAASAMAMPAVVARIQAELPRERNG